MTSTLVPTPPSTRGELVVRGAVDASGVRRDIVMRDGQIVDSGAGAEGRVVDATGLTVVPGLIDLQVNGAGGVDITDTPERLWECAAALPRFGVTAFVPVVITSAPHARERALETLAGGPPDGWQGAIPLGIHFEGPMIAPSHKGAHPQQWLAPPSADVIAGWSRERGVLISTIAPELPGALEAIAELTSRGVLVSVGHTGANGAQVEAAVAAGARLMTHFGNAMAPLRTREPGPIGVALGGDDLVVGVIVDGYHVDPKVVALAWKALGPGRFLAVTDTTMALGMPDGLGRLGDQTVRIGEGTVRLSDGTLAGSAASLPQCLRALRSATGCTLAEGVATMTTTPAAVVHDPSRGTFDAGTRGDLTLLDADLDVAATIIGGQVAYRAEEGH